MSARGPGHLDLLYSSNYSDALLRCRGHEFKVHRSILEHESEFFRALYAGPWKVSLTVHAIQDDISDDLQENSTSDRSVDLDLTEPQFLEQALRFFYARSLDAIQEPHMGDLVFTIKLYLFGDAYLSHDLRHHAYEKLPDLLNEFAPHVKNIASLEKLSNIVELVFTNTTGTNVDIRLILLQFFARHVRDMDYCLRRTPGYDDKIAQSLLLPASLTKLKADAGIESQTN